MYFTIPVKNVFFDYTSRIPTALKFTYFQSGMSSNKQALHILHMCKFTAT